MESELLGSLQTEGKKRFFLFSVHLHAILGRKKSNLSREGGMMEATGDSVQAGMLVCEPGSPPTLNALEEINGSVQMAYSYGLFEHIVKPPHRSQSVILLKPKLDHVPRLLQWPISLKESQGYIPAHPGTVSSVTSFPLLPSSPLHSRQTTSWVFHQHSRHAPSSGPLYSLFCL